ncbi:MAG: hypothetical protein AAGI30_05940 [Planctomycetota bacterium]
MGVLILAQQAGSASATGVADLPLSAHTLMVGVLLAGLYLWAFGERSVRTALSVVGLIVGGILGYFALGSLLGPLGVPPIALGIGGAIAGFIIAMLVFKGAVAATCAVIGGLFLPLATLVALEVTNPTAPPANEPSLADQIGGVVSTSPAIEPHQLTAEQIEAGREVLERVTPSASDVIETAERGAAQVRAFVGGLWHHVRPTWDRLPANRQLLVVLACVLGVIAGVGAGMLITKPAAIVATTFVGSAAWLSAGVWLLRAAERAPAFVDRWAAWHWTIAWVTSAALGLTLQLFVTRRKKTKTSNEKSD